MNQDSNPLGQDKPVNPLGDPQGMGTTAPVVDPDPQTTPDEIEQDPQIPPKRSLFGRLKQWWSNLFSKEYRWTRIIFLGLCGSAALFILFFIISVSFDLPPMDLIENPKSDQSTQVISADGEVLQKFYSRENRVTVGLEDISPYVINALISTEDARFLKHSGIDPRSFFSILKEALLGGGVRGGSTITMQLARNLYREQVGNESLYIRKPKEYIVSAILEKYFTKEEILAAYLNTVNIYGTSYGIETTANRLFDKTAKELDIEEAALIVGMLKGQGVYNPFRYPERTQARRNTILDQMRIYGTKEFKYLPEDTLLQRLMDEGRLTPEKFDIDTLKTIDIKESLVEQEESHIRGIAPYFREQVRKELKKWCEENDYDLYRDGLRVYTTLDSRMQRHAEAAMKKHLKSLQKDFDKYERRGNTRFKQHPKLVEDMMRLSQRYVNAKKEGLDDAKIREEFNKPRKMTIFTWDGPIERTMTPLDSIKHYARFLETGLMSIDPSNGHVKAWVGGIDFKYFKYDHVKQGKRQVGSTFKPFLYGTAIKREYSLCHKFLDQPVAIELPDGSVWEPSNSERNFGGTITLREAMANSLNLVSAKLITEVGPDAVADFAHQMGITSELDRVPSLALGTTDLSVFEMTHAYSTFVNKGVRTKPIFITRIEDKGGQVLEDFYAPSEEVLEPEFAYKIVELLRGVVDEGTARRLRFRYQFKNQIGGKTGTSQNQSDGWFMGVTPYLVTGTWVGHSDRRMHFSSIKYGQGANMALPIFAEYMKAVYADEEIDLPKDNFPIPPGIKAEDLACQVDSVSSDTGTKSDGSDPDELDGF